MEGRGKVQPLPVAAEQPAPLAGSRARSSAPARLTCSLHTPRVINAEKSEFNEDQAACCQISIRRREPGLEEDEEWLILCSTQVEPPGRLS